MAGVVLRDDLGRSSDALTRFSSLPVEHPDSRLVDDAYWQAALTARALERDERACDEAKHLAESRPNSRFVRCLGIPCPTQYQNADEARCTRLVTLTSTSGEPRPPPANVHAPQEAP